LFPAYLKNKPMSSTSPLTSLIVLLTLLTLTLQSHLRTATSTHSNSFKLNTTPIIGIVTLPSHLTQYPSENYSYLPASYVKFIESAGALVIPIQYDLHSSQLDHLLKQVNGFLFTGGSESLYNDDNFTDYGKTLATIFNHTVAANRAGNYTPLWGTCLGFEHIIKLMAGNYPLFHNISGLTDAAVNITFFQLALEKSRTFAGFPSDLIDKLQTEPIVYFNSEYALNLSDWETNQNLTDNLTIVAIARDADNKPVAAYFEGKELPIYGTHFHPEKVAFEWFGSKNIPHDFDAIRFEQWLGNFFVNEARKNMNTFENETSVREYMIENYEAVVSDESMFDTVYVFKNVNYTSTSISEDDFATSTTI